MPGISPAARDRDEGETIDTKLAQNLLDLAIIVLKCPGGVIGCIAKSITLDCDDPHLEPPTQGIQKRNQFGRAGACADAANEQHRRPAHFPRVGEMHRPPFPGLKALERRSDWIKMIGECNGLRKHWTCKGQCGCGQKTQPHRTGSVSKLLSSSGICASSAERSMLRHKRR